MQVSAEGKRGFILKNWLAQAVSKLALTGKKFTGFCKIMAVTHRHNGRSGKLGLTMLSIMTADLMWRIVSILT